MGTDTKIAWTHHTFSGWWGCQKVSAGCASCYADAFSKRIGHGKRLPTIWGGDDTTRKIASEKVWRDPIKWNAQAKAEGCRHRVFTASMSDVFEDRPDLVAPRARLFRLIEATPFLDWQALTKRPQNMVRLARDAGWSGAWPSNVWAGCTAEDQKNASERLPHLLVVPARILFVSYEPALGPVDFTPWLRAEPSSLSWIIVGGESGPNARMFDVDWMRAVIYQGQQTGTPVFCKQWGSRPYETGEGLLDDEGDGAIDVCPIRLKDPHGADMMEWPERYRNWRVREFPLARGEKQ